MTNKITFMGLWRDAWLWMQDNNAVLEPYQHEQIKNHNYILYNKDTPIKEMAYFLTQHDDGMRKHEKNLWEKWEKTEEMKNVILDYKIKMMEEWGWPEWGYADVKHLRKS